jgi:4'-phosphopantetheinyl transferase
MSSRRQPFGEGAPVDIADVQDIPTLAENELHLWLLPLDQPRSVIEGLAATLDLDERARASRFQGARNQLRFVARRGLLRGLLGSYLETASSLVRFGYRSAGKPFLRHAHGQPRLEFNLSHSGAWALLGVTREVPIGVDIQVVEQIRDYMDIARQYFAPGEIRALNRLSPAESIEGFYACWTRKEAYVKALGRGLSLALQRFDVSAELSAPNTTLSVDPSAGVADSYTVWGFKPLPDSWAAVAARGSGLSSLPLRLTRAFWLDSTEVTPVTTSPSQIHSAYDGSAGPHVRITGSNAVVRLRGKRRSSEEPGPTKSLTQKPTTERAAGRRVGSKQW